ncbi:helix-turn-helix domain-containing protein [Candidatus Uabimicrobium amorphum]|uniref:Helix-turn-helix domain-containing protein n=1 Tax=Uabimicrobium amorphum TaxID=2596890 RepID=A0A5S9IV45_UABAM|nr:helix-turn-helix domain-containing protein [Candidatus Uabimicrobium amorphum]BBM87145.1 hypothetical protein UABAM_05548 [Candidatus Uabimicrobium amorphum]
MSNSKIETLLEELIEQMSISNKEAEKSNQMLHKIYQSFEYQAHEQKKEFVSSAEAGQIISKSKYTVIRWIKSGRLDAVRINRRYFIAKSSLSRFLQQD